MPAVLRCRVAGIVSVACAVLGLARPLEAQGKSGPRSVDACGIATEAELEAALGARVRPSAIPASAPASIGVSVCMWATVDGRRRLSIATYGPEAVKRTVTRDLRTYYDSMKSSNAQMARRPAIVFPGVGRHASYFVNPKNAGDVILILRQDCVVNITASGLTRQQAEKVAAAAGH
jgi:hypothetical protein